jgi:hypothetical protein
MPVNAERQRAAQETILRATLARDGDRCWSCRAELRPGLTRLADIPLQEPDPLVPSLVSRARVLCVWCAETLR